MVLEEGTVPGLLACQHTRKQKTLDKIGANPLPSRFALLAYICQLGPIVMSQNIVTSWKLSV